MMQNKPKGQNGTKKVHPCLPTYVPASRKATRTFTLFPKLPTAIRLKIWKLALLFPIRVDLRVMRDKSRSGTDEEFKMVRQSMNPALTMVSTETRQVALEHHTLCFDETSYVNFTTDSGVCLRNCKAAGFHIFMSRLTLFELAGIENLILKLSVWRETSEWAFQRQIRKLTGLRMLQFLLEKEDEDYAFEVTRHLIRDEMMMARDVNDRTWKAPRVVIIDPYGLEDDEKPKYTSG